MGAKISALGRYLPEKVLTNYDLENIVETSDEWIRTRTGISQRRIAADNEHTSTLAIKAAQDVLKKGEVNPATIDLIIVATMMPDSPFPSVACKVQDSISALNAGAFDLAAACSGFVYGLEVASQFAKTNYANRILVIGSEVFSRFLDWEDRATCVLFGDGAGAALIEKDDKDYFLGGVLKSNGSGKHLLHMPAGGTEKPTSVETIQNRGHFLKMNGLELFQEVVPIICDVLVETADKTRVRLDEVSLFVPHQANVHIIEQVATMMDIPMERFMVNIERFGNTSAASIPLALIDAVNEGKVKTGDKIMLFGFGAGLTCAANVIEWNENCVY